LLLAPKGHNGPEKSPESITNMVDKAAVHGILNLAWKICLIFGLLVILLV